jgi:hypothetical protein
MFLSFYCLSSFYFDRKSKATNSRLHPQIRDISSVIIRTYGVSVI